MPVIEILLSGEFLTAIILFSILTVLCLPLLDRFHKRLEHPLLQWQWEHIAVPLSKAALLVMFILLAYPVIFAIEDAPSILARLSEDDLRINHLVNLLFIISLAFPLIPLFGNWHELILPLQGIAASMMIFSWLAASQAVTNYNFWPGWNIAAYCIAIAILTHWIATRISIGIGHNLDRYFDVKDSGELLARVLVLLMQTPVILVYSAGLGRQLAR